jgi:hypothetical protein
MKRNHTVWLAAALLVVAAGFMVAPSFAGDGDKHEMKEVTVEGILIDSKCYGMNPDNWAADHMTPKGQMPNCAQACANMGIPVGVLEGGKPGGDVYLLVTPSMALADHMAKEVKVVGMKTFEGAITPSQLFVKNNKGKWEEVKVGTMM